MMPFSFNVRMTTEAELILSYSVSSSTMDTLFLDGGQGSTPSSVNVHPVILFSLLDQHMRRGENQDRVIGALRAGVRHSWRRRGRCARVAPSVTWWLPSL